MNSILLENADDIFSLLSWFVQKIDNLKENGYISYDFFEKVSNEFEKHVTRWKNNEIVNDLIYKQKEELEKILINLN